MPTLDRSKPYGVINGHPIAAYEQNTLLFDNQGELIGTPKTVRANLSAEDKKISDSMESAKDFLMNILKNGALAKSVIYKTADGNNQSWDDVKNAATSLNVAKFTYNKSEMWRL